MNVILPVDLSRNLPIVLVFILSLTFPIEDDLCSDERQSLFTDPWQQFPQGRATWPDVQSAEHGYMKLATKRKILRVRQTIYEDPGNPFADESETEEVLSHPWFEYEKPPPPSPAVEEKSVPESDLFGKGVNHGGVGPLDYPLQTNAFIANRKLDAYPSPYRDGSSTIRAHRRSQSVAVPASSLSDDYGKYIAPRTFWRKASVPMNRPTQHGSSANETARDTHFYGFYDDIMQEYKSGDSRL